jgi:hypothetical protein
MISIIICGISNENFNILKQNIKESIGCEYEILRYDNLKDNKSICEVYNIQAAKANFEILLFIHEDILFNTENWGYKIAQHFKELPNPGVIGIAASSYVSKFPSSWGNILNDNFKYVNIIQSEKSKTNKIHIFKNNQKISQVILLDGVFIACNKEKFKSIKFNEFIKGFHMYDYTISIDFHLKGFKNYFINDVLITHYSIGSIDKNLYLNSIKANKLYEKILPVSIQNQNDKETESLLFDAILYKSFKYQDQISQFIKIILFYYSKSIKIIGFKKSSFQFLKFIVKILLFKLGFISSNKIYFYNN